MQSGRSKVVIGIIVVILVIAGSWWLFERHSTSNDKTTTTSKTDQVNSSDALGPDAVKIQNMAFDSANLSVKVGTAVTWVNQDQVGHSVTSDTGSAVAFDSGILSNGSRYSFTFTTAGVYTYHCKVHPDMHGTITVTE